MSFIANAIVYLMTFFVGFYLGKNWKEARQGFINSFNKQKEVNNVQEERKS
jgi:hypothetical protein